MLDICIRPARPLDHDQLLRFRQALWPNSSAEEHARELSLILEGEGVTTLPLIILVAELVADASERTLTGFLEVDLRSHADCCDPSRPVGYIEGCTLLRSIETRESGRNSWLRQKTGRSPRCVEVASDTWIDNEVSQRVHEALGYEVVDRCVHYRKTL